MYQTKDNIKEKEDGEKNQRTEKKEKRAERYRFPLSINLWEQSENGQSLTSF